VHGIRRKLVAVDRSDDGPEGVSRGVPEKRDRVGPELGQGVPARPETAETRTRSEYYQALRATVDEQVRIFEAARASANGRPRSGWDNADASTRPPLDALRLPPDRAIHILDGDATGGGHLYGTGTSGKTEFPASWDEDKITDSILSIARSPDSAQFQKNGRWKVEGVRDEVALAVVINADGRIWTAYPLPGSPGVRQNPRNV
jgi:Bacterial EndoU nuclease